MDFTKVVKKKMAEKEITISEVARATGYSVQYISDLISGNRRWNETTISKVSKVLGIEICFKDEAQPEQESA